MKRKQQITHYMTYETYNPRDHSQQRDECLDNRTNNRLTHLIYQQQPSVTQSQQNLQPTHYCSEQTQMQQLEPEQCFNTAIAATDSLPVLNCFNSTNTKMSSLLFGNNYCQINLKESLKTEQKEQQRLFTDNQLDQIYLNNNYYLNDYNNNNNNNNNNNYNCNYAQQYSSPRKIINTNNSNFYNISTQKQEIEKETILIKEEFVEHKLNDQHDRNKKLDLCFPTNLHHQYQVEPSLTNSQTKSNNMRFEIAATTTNINPTATTTTNVNDKITMDAREIANFLANELFMQQVSLNRV